MKKVTQGIQLRKEREEEEGEGDEGEEISYNHEK